MRICIVTPGPVGSNPRVVKEAGALREAGHEVIVVCSRMLARVEPRDQDVLASATWKTERIDLSNLMRWRFERMRQIGMRTLFAVTRLSSFANTGFSAFTHKLIRKAISYPADLYIAHYPAALPAAAMAARQHRGLCAYDAEDFHPGDWPEDIEFDGMRRMLRAIESRYLPDCAYVTAASPGIADAYAREYLITRPTVVLNVFPRSQAPTEPASTGTVEPRPSVYWFSQTIGYNRGLECGVRAIGRARSRPHLYLRGTPAAGFVERLRAIANEHGVVDQLHILPPALPSEMERLTSLFDVGFSGEPGHTENNRVALGNKLFSYLLAGIPAAISDVDAHRAYGHLASEATRLFRVDDADNLAAVLDSLLTNPAALAAARRAAWRLGQERYNWDLEKNNLLNTIIAACRTRK